MVKHNIPVAYNYSGARNDAAIRAMAVVPPAEAWESSVERQNKTNLNENKIMRYVFLILFGKAFLLSVRCTFLLFAFCGQRTRRLLSANTMRCQDFMCLLLGTYKLSLFRELHGPLWLC